MSPQRRPTNERALIADVGDFHINSTTGLLTGPVDLDDGGQYYPSRGQAWIAAQFRRYVELVAKAKAESGLPLWVLLKGELADLNHHRTTQLVTRNEIDVVNMAIQTLEPLVKVADKIIVIRGTEAHVGASGWLDEAVAKSLGTSLTLADKIVKSKQFGTYSHFVWRGRIGGVSLHVAHHPGAASRVPNTRGSEANRAGLRIFDEYSQANVRLWRAGRPLLGWPDLALFGHNHKPADSLDHHPVRVIITPSWQLNTAYGHRIGGGLLPVGGNIIYCRGDHRYDIHPFHVYPPIPSAVFGGEPHETI